MGQRPRRRVREHAHGQSRLEVELEPDLVTGGAGAPAGSSQPRTDAPRFTHGQRWPSRQGHRWPGRSEPHPTLNELIDQWLEHRLADGVATATVTDRRDELRRYVRPHLGDARIDRIRPYDVDRLYRQLLHGGGRRASPEGFRVFVVSNDFAGRARVHPMVLTMTTEAVCDGRRRARHPAGAATILGHAGPRCGRRRANRCWTWRPVERDDAPAALRHFPPGA